MLERFQGKGVSAARPNAPRVERLHSDATAHAWWLRLASIPLGTIL